MPPKKTVAKKTVAKKAVAKTKVSSKTSSKAASPKVVKAKSKVAKAKVAKAKTSPKKEEPKVVKAKKVAPKPKVVRKFAPKDDSDKFLFTAAAHRGDLEEVRRFLSEKPRRVSDEEVLEVIKLLNVSGASQSLIDELERYAMIHITHDYPKVRRGQGEIPWNVEKPWRGAKPKAKSKSKAKPKAKAKRVTPPTLEIVDMAEGKVAKKPKAKGKKKVRFASPEF